MKIDDRVVAYTYRILLQLTPASNNFLGEADRDQVKHALRFEADRDQANLSSSVIKILSANASRSVGSRVGKGCLPEEAGICLRCIESYLPLGAR